jgi:uncharacterized membrane protein YGL010W
MKTLDDWLALYGEGHQNPKNQLIHKICVPIIFWTVVSFLWLIPLGPVRLIVPIALVSLIFYFRLGLKAGSFMAVQILVAIMISAAVQLSTGQLPIIAGSLFIVAWVGQFVGHKIEGKRPSFFTDLQFLLIGPLWLFKDFLQWK